MEALPMPLLFSLSGVAVVCLGSVILFIESMIRHEP
jgi:hypothetical protein